MLKIVYFDLQSENFTNISREFSQIFEIIQELLQDPKRIQIRNDLASRIRLRNFFWDSQHLLERLESTAFSVRVYLVRM